MHRALFVTPHRCACFRGMACTSRPGPFLAPLCICGNGYPLLGGSGGAGGAYRHPNNAISSRGLVHFSSFARTTFTGKLRSSLFSGQVPGATVLPLLRSPPCTAREAYRAAASTFAPLHGVLDTRHEGIVQATVHVLGTRHAPQQGRCQPSGAH